jgi:hypothetical protein
VETTILRMGVARGFDHNGRVRREARQMWWERDLGEG